MSHINNFRPVFGSNLVITASSSSSETALPANVAEDLLVQNTGANKGYVRLGPTGGTATTADLPIASGQGLIMRKMPSDAAIDVISSAGTTFEVIRGIGN